MTDSSKRDIYSLLDDMGFGLPELAQAIGYPAGALHAFRDGQLPEEDPDFEYIRLKLADIVTMTGRVAVHRGGVAVSPDEGTLFRARLLDGYAVTGWNLYRYLDGIRCLRASLNLGPGTAPGFRGQPPIRIEPQHNGLCALASGNDPEQVLDWFIPGWRDRFRTGHHAAADDETDAIRRRP